MEICSDNHEEIVYEKGHYNSSCPLCVALEELNSAKKEIDLLEKELNNIEEYECQTCHDVRKLKE